MRRIISVTAPRFAAWLSATAGLLMLATAVLSSPVHAVSADAFVREVGTDTLQALGDRSLDQTKREAVMRKLLVDHLDLEAVGRFCLGRYSRSMNEAQQKEYYALFQDYLVKVYSALLAQYNGESLSVQDGTREIEGAQLVSSQILRPSGPPIRVEWKLVDKAGQLKLTDVVVEGVSMAFTQRQQFESVIQNNGGRVQALLDAMKKQISR
ncbi:phospholipid-binding protein MlaC [Ferrovibrio sp.]|uniref:MlaC/ttg2D family ABC transporter substrate-binding protein n=2 Tax=Ferrovibrio sp. TaxID=1917215 RepID=UPI0035B43ED5